MIYTVFAEISSLNTEGIINKGGIDRPENFKENYIKGCLCGDFSTLSIPVEIKEHIFKANDPDLRKERCAAYYLLVAICQKLIGFMPKIDWNNSGKPKFVNNCLYFNLSHTNNMVAVTLSDSCAVGVDVEVEIGKERAERLERRFFSDLTISDRPIDVEYFCCQFDSFGGGRFIPMDSCDLLNEKGENMNGKNLFPIKNFKKIYSTDSFSAKWTLYEASLKCDGGGFTSLPCLSMLLLETKADTRLIETDCLKYYLSTSAR